MFIGMNYINGDFCRHRPDRYTTNSISGCFPVTNKYEMLEAVTYSKSAFLTWKEISSMTRSAILEELLISLYSNYNVILETIIAEFGMNSTDTHNVSTHIDYLLQNALKSIDTELSVSGTATGSTAFITSWKFGIDPIFCHLFRALMWGNTLIWIPDSQSCVTAQMIVDLANQTRLSAFPGVLQLLHGNYLTASDLLKHVDATIMYSTNVVGMALQTNRL